MSDRLTDIEIALQRMAESARNRGDDIRYSRQQEDFEHVARLDMMLGMLEKVRGIVLQERARFVSVDQPAQVRQHPNPTQQSAMPKVVQKGPAS